MRNTNSQSQYGFILFLLVGLFFSCADNSGNAKTEKSFHNTSIKPGSSFTDTLNIDFPAAVFYGPDSLQLQKLKSATKPEIFDGSMHEYEYLMRNSRLVIKKTVPAAKIVEVKNVRYLLFIKADRTREYIDLDTKSEPYGLLLFNRQKDPQLVDMSNIETALEFYFFK